MAKIQNSKFKILIVTLELNENVFYWNRAWFYRRRLYRGRHTINQIWSGVTIRGHDMTGATSAILYFNQKTILYLEIHHCLDQVKPMMIRNNAAIRRHELNQQKKRLFIITFDQL
jgi:hypothetical protein